MLGRWCIVNITVCVTRDECVWMRRALFEVQTDLYGQLAGKRHHREITDA